MYIFTNIFSFMYLSDKKILYFVERSNFKF